MAVSGAAHAVRALHATGIADNFVLTTCATGVGYYPFLDVAALPDGNGVASGRYRVGNDLSLTAVNPSTAPSDG